MKSSILSLFFLICIFTTSTKAQDYAASVKISTLGINLEALRSFGSDFNARVGFAFFNYSLDGGSGGDQEDFKYSGKLKLFSVSALGDWFPFESSSFRLTAGALINLNKGDLVLTPSKSYPVGGTTYSPEDLGDLNAKIDFNKVAPYIGFGFGNPTAGNAGFDFTFDVGTIYQGSPKAEMSAEGLLKPSAEQGPQLEENLKWFRFYPVLSLGLTYKF